MSFRHHSLLGRDQPRLPLPPSPLEYARDHHYHHARYYTPMPSPHQQNSVHRSVRPRGCSSEEQRDWDHAHHSVRGLEHATQLHPRLLHQPPSMYRFTTPEHNLDQWRSLHSTSHMIGYSSRCEQDQRRISHQHLSSGATNKAYFVAGSSRRHSSLPPRPAVMLSNSATDSNGRAFPRLSVMTYNILAQDLIEKNGYLYTHAETEHLEWTYRRMGILHELIQSKADVSDTS